LVHRLNDEPGVDRVIGIDVVSPRTDLGRAEFVRADIRNPIIARVIGAAEVDTVVHSSVSSGGAGAPSRSAAKEVNVIGTMQLLAACQKAPSLRRLIVKSSTSVYGASARDPALFDETMEPVAAPSGGYARDAVEVETYVRGFARRRADVGVTVFRFANFMGPDVDSPITRLLTLPVVPTALGHDPRLQFVHVDDGLEILRRAVVGDFRGVFNVAGCGVLTMSQAVRRAGRPSVAIPGPALSRVSSLLRRGMPSLTRELLEFLIHGRAVDTTRLRETFGYTPSHTTGAAFDAFLEARGRGPLTPDRIAAAADGVLDVVQTVTRYLPGPRVAPAAHPAGGAPT